MTSKTTTTTNPPIVSVAMLNDTLVPAMRDLLQQLETKREARRREEEKDQNGTNDNDTNQDNGASNDENQHGIEEEFTEVLLECLAGFVAISESGVAANDEATAERKNAFVTSGAFEMTMHVLRQFLDDFIAEHDPPQKNANDYDSGATNKKEEKAENVETSIAAAHTAANFTTTSKIPSLTMTILAHLTWSASDALKKDRVLPLMNLVHKCMTTFLTDANVQGFGCWIMHNLSNPLLQELLAAGSLSIVVSSMKRHPEDSLVQEHGNAALYNLLPLVLINNNNRLDIDRLLFREISALLPSLPAIVLRGMEQNVSHLSVQQFGLLVLDRICQKDQEYYEVFVSEGGLTILMNNLKMTIDSGEDRNDNDGIDDITRMSIIEKRDCLAQLSCQFLRDLSRPTNSSMDILRIIAVKGGITALVHLLDRYKADASSSSRYHSHNVINIVDPAMACLRNLFCDSENIRQGMADNAGNHRVIPTVLQTMDCFPQDAAVQAYGCDLLGRLAQSDSARREIRNTTVIGIPSQADTMVTVVRAMNRHRSHTGVQERAIVLLWAMIIHDTKHSSSLISRLREVHNEEQRQNKRKGKGGEMVVVDLIIFLKETRITPRGLDRLRELVSAVEQYEQGKVPVVGKWTEAHQEKENASSHIRSYLKGWFTGEQDETPVSPTNTA
jgi:hypothetical protein